MPPATREPASPPSVHRLKVTLRGVRPPIWRRLLVPSGVTLAKLHDILQRAMGWHDSHLHLFRTRDATYGDRIMLDDPDVRSERTSRLGVVAPTKGSKLWYDYDFGDGWEHEILVEAVVPPDAGARYPVCLGGRRACPPEDSGGVWGYADLIEIVGDPGHEDHAAMTEWLGRPLDPEAFDVEAVNRRLAALGRRLAASR